MQNNINVDTMLNKRDTAVVFDAMREEDDRLPAATKRTRVH